MRLQGRSSRIRFAWTAWINMNQLPLEEWRISPLNHSHTNYCHNNEIMNEKLMWWRFNRMWVFDSPSFIDVKTCCSCLENQTEFKLSARPSFIHNFRLAPLNGKWCNLQHDFFFMQYLQSGALNICLPLALATLKLRLGTKNCECRIFSTAILFI